MKIRIIQNSPGNTASLVDYGHFGGLNKRYYGVVVKIWRGFITSDYDGSGPYMIRMPDGLVTGKYVEVQVEGSIFDCVSKLVNEGYEVYVFDTFEELMEWVSNPDKIS